MAEIETCKKYPSRRFIFQESGRDIYVSYIYVLTDIYCIPLQEKDFPGRALWAITPYHQ